MKWFRHNSDSFTNLKMQELLDAEGLEGYGIFWLCCELVAQQGDESEFSLNGDKAWKRALVRVSKLSEKRVDALLQKCAELRLISADDLKKGKLSIPKMADYVDEYTAKLRRVSGQTPDNVRLHNNTRHNNTLQNKTTQDMFDRFWENYPRKTAKQAAIRAFSKLSPDKKLFEAVLSGIEAWKKSSQWLKDSGEYIPHPASFLNGRRWEDEVPMSSIKSLKIP